MKKIIVLFLTLVLMACAPAKEQPNGNQVSLETSTPSPLPAWGENARFYQTYGSDIFGHDVVDITEDRYQHGSVGLLYQGKLLSNTEVETLKTQPNLVSLGLLGDTLFPKDPRNSNPYKVFSMSRDMLKITWDYPWDTGEPAWDYIPLPKGQETILYVYAFRGSNSEGFTATLQHMKRVVYVGDAEFYIQALPLPTGKNTLDGPVFQAWKAWKGCSDIHFERGGTMNTYQGICK